MRFAFGILAALFIASIFPTAASLADAPTTQASDSTTDPDASVLITQHFVVTVIDQREEGELINDHVIYVGVSKQDGKSIRLIGSTWYHYSPVDNCPSHFLGYQFKNGDVRYYVHDDGELEVVRGGNKTLLDETGTWVR